jgi:hypothetical protein
VEVSFRNRMKHVPTTMTLWNYLCKHGVRRSDLYYDEATGRELTPGATLEEMGYRGGKLAVLRR